MSQLVTERTGGRIPKAWTDRIHECSLGPINDIIRNSLLWGASAEEIIEDVLTAIPSRERTLVLGLLLHRQIAEVQTRYRGHLITKLDRVGIHVNDPRDPYLSFDQIAPLARQFCQSYVIVHGIRQRAGTCTADDLTAAASDYRRQADYLTKRAVFLENLADQIRAIGVSTLDDYAVKCAEQAA